ncbi:DNA-binding protein RFX8 [Manis javanica]|nr:DNA-binding protein RFX8 [Manis javanica]
MSRALTLCHRDSFGSWHLFHLLLLEYVIHILQSCIEEEEEDDTGSHKEMLLDDHVVLSVLGFLVDTAMDNKLIQVLLEDEATGSSAKLILPVRQEALITLSDGQKFVIHISDVPQSSENIYFGESNANM